MTLFAVAPVLVSAALAVASSDEPFVLRGIVLDASRAPVAGARVTALPRAGGRPVATSSEGGGAFTLALAPGGYEITVSAPGLREIRQGLEATAAGAASREFVLELPLYRETVTVSAPAGYQVADLDSATRTLTPLRDVPQAVTVATRELMKDQLMTGMGDVLRYVPGVAVHQGENNRDQAVIRGNSTSADFFLDGVRDDVQYYRDLYNLERVEALKGPSAMVFGRGGGGGVINRVRKEAVFSPLSELTVQGGSFGHKRAAVDLDRPLSGVIALRVNGMYESSDSFRRAVGLERYAVNPTLTFTPGARTKITVAYEHLHDTRVADRGIPSRQGRPADVDVATFFGDPAQSHVRARVDLGSAAVEHRAGPLTIRNRTLLGGYDRFYQNFVPGAVAADGSRVALTAYNNATARVNLFNQTDLVYTRATGSVRHTLLAGIEAGRQASDNFRNTGFFGAAASTSVPWADPAGPVAVSFRQSATDADNHVRASVAAAYAQDQVELARWLRLVAGVRFDRFGLRYHNNRTQETLERIDHLVSPRAGVVLEPAERLSLYGSGSVSYLPSSGDQFSSLTAVTRQMEPEKFTGYEIGAKWDARPGLSLTTAVYRLDRTNTRSTDPNDPTRIVQTGAQRTSGFELGVNGRLTHAWRVAGGYAYQDAFVTRATASARAGAQVGQVPHHTLSLWSHCQLHPRAAAAVGILYRTDMYAAIDDTVTLPGYVRVDAAAYLMLRRALRLQANVENVLDRRYYLNADSNTSISPGSPRAFRVALTSAF